MKKGQTMGEKGMVMSHLISNIASRDNVCCY
jgi:hypothetical protein